MSVSEAREGDLKEESVIQVLAGPPDTVALPTLLLLFGQVPPHENSYLDSSYAGFKTQLKCSRLHRVSADLRPPLLRVNSLPQPCPPRSIVRAHAVYESGSQLRTSAPSN